MSINSRRTWTPVLVAGMVVPLVVAGAVLAGIWSGLPDPVATHWGPGGAADGFTARGLPLVLLTLGLPAVLGLVLHLVLRRVPASAPGVMLAGAIPGSVVWLVATVGVGGLLLQVDRVEPPTTGAVGPVLLAGLVAAGLGGWLCHRLAPPAPDLPDREGPPAAGAPRLAGEGAPLAWTGRAMLDARAGLLVLVVLVVVLAATTVAALADPSDGGWAPVVFVVVVEVAVLLLVLTMSVFRVTVGARQVTVVGLLGRPRIAVPLVSVRQARVAPTGILAWGGLGLRYRSGRTGVITRSGPALELERTDGSLVVVTLDDAGSAAATVNSLLERAGRAG